MSGTVGITLGIYLQPFKDGLKNAETMSANALDKINQKARNAANEQSKIFKDLGANVGSEAAYKKIAELQKQITEGARGSTTAIARMQTAGLTTAGSKAVSIHRETVKNMGAGFSFEEATQKAEQDFNKLKNSATDTAQKIQKDVNGIKFEPLKAQLYELRNLLLTAFSVGTVTETVKTGLAFESVRASLKSMTGSVREANDEFNFLKKNSKETGANILASATDFRLLVGASAGTGTSMETLEKTFSAVSTASAVLGLRAEDTSGIMRAMGQIMSKGTVQAEELKGQIGDRLPGALGLAAKAMGVTNKELLKMMESGTLMSAEFIPKFTKAINDEYVKGLSDAQLTALFGMKSMYNQWQLLQDGIVNGTSGLGQTLGTVANSIASGLEVLRTADLSSVVAGLKAVTAAYVLTSVASMNLTASQLPKSILAFLSFSKALDVTSASFALNSTMLKANTGQIIWSTEAKAGAIAATNGFTASTIASSTAARTATVSYAALGGTLIASLAPVLPFLLIAGTAFAVFFNSSKKGVDDLALSMKTLSKETAGALTSQISLALYKVNQDIKDGSTSWTADGTTSQLIKQRTKLEGMLKEIQTFNKENNEETAKQNAIQEMLDNVKLQTMETTAKKIKNLKAEETRQLNRLTELGASEAQKNQLKEYYSAAIKEAGKADAEALKTAKISLSELQNTLLAESLTGYDKILAENKAKFAKWQDDINKLAGKGASSDKISAILKDAKATITKNAADTYEAGKKAFGTEFTVEYVKAMDDINTKYTNFVKTLSKEDTQGKQQADIWKNKAENLATYNDWMKQANELWGIRESQISALSDEAEKERQLAALAQEKIQIEKTRRIEYGQTQNKVIESLTAQGDAQKTISERMRLDKAQDRNLELLSLVTTRAAREDYLKMSYDKELELLQRAGYTRAEAEFIALEKSKTAWDTYVDDISYSYTNMMEGLQDISKNAFKGMEDAFVTYMKTGKWNSKQFVDAIISDLMRMTVQMTITANLAKALGMGTKMIGDWWNTPPEIGAGQVDVGGGSTPIPGRANGAAYVGGVEKFAKGGTFSNSIVSKPTLFKFAKGTGMMGEAGAEAIMPLTRDSSGKLGVSASGAGGGVQNVKVEVINQSGTQVQANDVKISQSEQNGMIISIIVDDIRRGGAVAQAIRS